MVILFTELSLSVFTAHMKQKVFIYKGIWIKVYIQWIATKLFFVLFFGITFPYLRFNVASYTKATGKCCSLYMYSVTVFKTPVAVLVNSVTVTKSNEI